MPKVEALQPKTLRSRAASAFELPFTALPNHLIDEVMPTLKDTEWRVLCVIVRQTLGWSDGKGERKKRDWLSQKQLMARTGRNSAAISAALDALVRRRLIEAWDELGNLLLTPGQRRAHQGRIFYGLLAKSGKEEMDKTEAVAQNLSPKTPLHKTNTTKETEDKRKFIKRKASQKEDMNDEQELNGKEAGDVSLLRVHTGWMNAFDVAFSRYASQR